MVKAKSQFKRRSTANNVEIVIPVPAAEIDELLATAPGVADEASATEAKETR